MYPEMLEDAKSEGHKQAERSFNFANEVEKIHHKLYTKALEAAEENKDLKEIKMFVCNVCGFTVEGEAPEVCPICGAVHSKFFEVE
jgi:rubrerythrin